MTKLEQTIAEVREKLSNVDTTFLLIYSVENKLTESYDTRITSNSSQTGIRAILAAILQPCEKAIEIVAEGLEGAAFASQDVSLATLEQAKKDGEFIAAAKLLLDVLRPWYTIAGWTDDPKKPSQN
jgi:hypothetical protein